MQIVIYQSSGDRETFAFTRGEPPPGSSWKKIGVYQPSEARAGLPTYAVLDEELSKADTDYVTSTSGPRIERHLLP